jgi:drug/metabolite transporter (DMT)-like permease
MPIASSLIGILFALTSALVWGAGDFTGGYATRKSNQYVVLVISALSGLAVLILAALVWREPFPSARGMLWAALGGISGALGIAAFYRALSLGHTAIVAPLAAVIGAASPVVVNLFIAGWPAWTQLLGFALALVGIWLVSTAPAAGARISRQGLVLACLGGLGFGGFFVFLGLVDRGTVFTPLIIARSMTLSVGLILVALQRLRLPSITSNRLALLAGVLDAGGNLFYVLARQFTRLDVAAVLSSLYPASTVFLASLLLKERASRYQWVGVAICLCAIALITV